MSTSFDYNNPFAALVAKMPAVRLALPRSWFFKLPPAPFPRTLSSPPDHPTLAHPFTISTERYNRSLDGRIPFTIAIVYITVISGLNSLNKSRGYAPWAFSKTRLFRLMVVSHNIILAAYSMWTFIGMFNALQRSVYNPYHEWGLAGTVDSMCKLNGPRGVGSAAVYNERAAGWSIANRFFHLGADGIGPDSTDVGRMWNEGLAFYGWLFYLSKFYEVIDTLIIISKGKRSSFLQTYHHAGAMICMWAGIRYMSPPIWMFVFVNSFIHSIMYSFYLCTALGIRIPVWFKRTLTTLQITQFVVGASYAFIHLFIEYQSPISIPYHYTPGSPVEDIVSDVSSVISSATATVSANLGAHIKKALLRAAGREGLAENVLNDQGRTFGADTDKAVRDLYRRQVTEYRDELQWTHCLDTSGQAFAIYLNVLYLLPLTVLFSRFFIKSYLRRLERRRSSTSVPVPMEKRAHDLRESFSDATKGARRSVASLGGPQEGDEDTDVFIDDAEFEQQKQEVKQEAKKAWREVDKSARNAADSATKQINKGLENAKKNAGPAAEKAKGKLTSAAENTSQSISDISEKVNQAASGSSEGMNRTLDGVKQQADSVKAQTESFSQIVGEKAEAVYEGVKSSIASAKDALIGNGIDASKAQEIVEDVQAKGSETARKTTEVLQSGANSASQSVQDTASTVKQAVVSNVEKAKTSEDGSRKVTGSDDASEKAGQDSSKEQVRDSDVQEDSKTEPRTGDAKEDSTSANKSKPQASKSKDVTSPKKSNKKGTNVKDTHDKEHAGENLSNQKASPKKSDTKKGVSSPTTGNKGASENKTEGKSEGRQSFYEDERKNALEQVKSAASEGSESVIPGDNEVEAAQKKSPKKKSKSTAGGSKHDTDKTQEAKPSFDETRSEALEKIKSATSQSQGDQELDASQNFDDQKESWIDVGNQRSPKSKKAAEANKQKGGKSDAKSSSEPEWFERLTTSTDSPKKTQSASNKDVDESAEVVEGVSFADAVKEHTDADEPKDSEGTGTTGTKTSATESKADRKEKAQQDKIIDESEPVRDDVQEEIEQSPSSNPASPRWHRRRKG